MWMIICTHLPPTAESCHQLTKYGCRTECHGRCKRFRLTLPCTLLFSCNCEKLTALKNDKELFVLTVIHTTIMLFGNLLVIHVYVFLHVSSAIFSSTISVSSVHYRHYLEKIAAITGFWVTNGIFDHIVPKDVSCQISSLITC